MYTYEYIKDLMFNLSKYKTQVEFAYEFSDEDDVILQKEKEVVLMELFLKNLDFEENQIMSSKLEHNDSYNAIAERFKEVSKVGIYKRVKKVIEKAVDLFNSTLKSCHNQIDLTSLMTKADENRIEYLIKNYTKMRLMVNVAYAQDRLTEDIKTLSDDLAKLRFIVDSLDKDEVTIIKQCYFAKNSITKIALRLNMSVSTLRRRRDNAVKEIQSRMFEKMTNPVNKN